MIIDVSVVKKTRASTWEQTSTRALTWLNLIPEETSFVPIVLLISTIAPRQQSYARQLQGAPRRGFSY